MQKTSVREIRRLPNAPPCFPFFTNFVFGFHIHDNQLLFYNKIFFSEILGGCEIAGEARNDEVGDWCGCEIAGEARNDEVVGGAQDSPLYYQA